MTKSECEYEILIRNLPIWSIKLESMRREECTSISLTGPLVEIENLLPKNISQWPLPSQYQYLKSFPTILPQGYSEVNKI